MITIDGLVSGIDTEVIVEGLLEIQQAQINRLEIRRQELQGKQAAYESLEAQLASFKSTADTLSRLQPSPFQARSVNVSKESALFAAANTQAATGTYQIHIDSIARAHQIAAVGLSATDAAITQGTLDIQIGSDDPVTITINDSNDTLQGLADAINIADAGVSATIVNDGSTGGTPFRLLLTADETGLENQISITNNLGATTATETQPVFDLLNPVQAASDSVVRLGSGPGALSVSNSTNEVDDLIQGVTLNLLEADPDQEIQVRVSANTEPATSAINELVDTYNAIMNFIDELVRFNPETEEAGLLIGDRTVTDIQNEIRAAMLDVVPGLDSDANRLSILGITVNDRSRLTVNATRLEEVLSGRADGIDESDLKELFSLNRADPDANPAGIATRLRRLIDDFIDVENGGLTSAKDGISSQLGSLADSIKRQQAAFDAQEEDLIAQFVALESAISELQTTGNFLAAQLINLPQIGNR